MTEWDAKMYDSAGNEMVLKPGHVWVFGNNTCAQVRIENAEWLIPIQLIYNPPEEKPSVALKRKLEHVKGLVAEYGCDRSVNL